MLDVKGRKPIELSKVGDPFVNFIYSLALSKTHKRPLGKKVSNRILSEALARTKLREQAGSRMKKGDLGDFTEGIIFKAWAEGMINLEEAVEILARRLNPTSSGKQVHEEAVDAFESLLNHIKVLWQK
jgi:hypothetical protein